LTITPNKPPDTSEANETHDRELLRLHALMERAADRFEDDRTSESESEFYVCLQQLDMFCEPVPAHVVFDEQRTRRLVELHANIHRDLDGLRATQHALRNSTDAYGFYRYYHHSFKVYGLQASTKQIVELFERVAPALHDVRGFNPNFTDLITEGTSLDWGDGHNDNWTDVTRPIVEAYAHCRYFLDELIRTAESYPTIPTGWMREGWAAVLYLFNLRDGSTPNPVFHYDGNETFITNNRVRLGNTAVAALGGDNQTVTITINPDRTITLTARRQQHSPGFRTTRIHTNPNQRRPGERS
jgi:hypothetical protein